MKNALWAALFLIAAGSAACAQSATGPSGLRVVSRIVGPDGGWDYASFDAKLRRVFIAHGDSVMMIQADTGVVRSDFAKGNHLHAVTPAGDRAVTTNSGDNTAKVIDARTGALLASIPAPQDTDSAAYDTSSGKVVVIGGDSGEVELVDPKALTGGTPIKVGGQLEFGAPDGEGRFFINVADANQIAVLDLKSRQVVSRWPMPGCRRPTGMAFVSGDRLVSACGNGVAEIVSAKDGKIIASLIIGEGPDAVLYDQRRGLALIPSGRTGTLAVIALSGPHANTVIDTVPTQVGARTGAVDPVSGRVWLPTAEYVLPAPPHQRPAMKPGSFAVLILSR